ncbi:type 1 glutamine amidotransferase [Pseudonocardia xishanensis]|uniref:Glutamine amidotransferase domain-containing protein n=1 Tax=Pseudonocardia xishanensis TaxID=630995 RepID=A0ABP8RHK3_9PSEU
MPRALIVVHETDPVRQRRIPGTILPALEELGFAVEIDTHYGGNTVREDADLVVVMGSAHAAYDDSLPWLAAELDFLRRSTAPVLGVCFGGQALSRALGGTVARAARPERGFVDLRGDLPAHRWMEFHYDAFTLPPGAELVARNETGIQAFRHGPHLGLQFHPEITTDVFATWRESWSPEFAASVAAEVDVDAISAEISSRADELAAQCRALLARFCARVPR